jgi:hypothetical protein
VTAPYPRQHLTDVWSFVRRELAGLNLSCRGVAARLPEWVARVGEVLRHVGETARRLEPGRAQELLRPLGLIVASGERHAQFAGHEPGWIVRQFDGLDRAMLAAAGQGRPPVLTAELYWQPADPAEHLTFTAEPHERRFHAAVRVQVALRATVNHHLRTLDGGWPLDSVEGARLVRVAAAVTRESRCQYMEMRRGDAHAAAMTAAEYDDLRAWLAPTVLRGQRFDGPDPDHLADLMVTDILIGTVDEDYPVRARTLGRYQSSEARAAVAADLRRRPLVLSLAEALGYGEAEFDRAAGAELADRVDRAARPLRLSLLAFAALVDHHVGASGARLGLLGGWRGQPRQPVRPSRQTDAGDDALVLHQMRCRARRVTKLIAAIRQSPRSTPTPTPA